ncbi:MAG: ATPase, T2SS/T4P/T4SS family, partial [Candidatus Micrarchaeota archaeon]
MEILDQYKVLSDGVPAEVIIARKDDEYVDTYELKQIKLHKATEAALKQMREKIVEGVGIRTPELLDSKSFDVVKQKFIEKSNELVKIQMGEISEDIRTILVGKLTHDLIGLGDVELILADNNLEDICITSYLEPMWVYHRKHGWLKTNFVFESEEQIANYAAIVARKVGRQISNLQPLLDAHLDSGERVNAMLFPISNKGNAITIRKFAKNPWTITRLLSTESKLMSSEVAALLWLCIQYEMNIIVGGGTASGKTSILNALLLFIPPNQRVISIEDTREILLPSFLQWTPMVTRLANPEGKGEVTMLDLMVNSLRMRPDRIVVGEVRRQKEAEVLFEAMHTGHSV